MKARRYLLAVLASGAAIWLAPFVLAIVVFNTDTGLDKLGRPDDAPGRASAALLYISPIAVVICGSVFALIVGALRLLGRNSLHALFAASALIAVCVGVVFAAQGFSVGGLKDAALSFSIFGMGAFFCLALGSLVWWRCVPPSSAEV